MTQNLNWLFPTVYEQSKKYRAYEILLFPSENLLAVNCIVLSGIADTPMLAVDKTAVSDAITL